MSEEIEFELRRFLDDLNERFNEAKRELRTSSLEHDEQVLDAIHKLSKRLDDHEARLSKVEDTSAWNLLVEEAGKMGVSPEQLLKKAITEYVKKQKGSLK